jgi:hypothetical protein
MRRFRKKQGMKNCGVCGNEVPQDSPWKDYCCLRCWGEDHHEDPEPTHDKIEPFEGYRVGQ